LFVHCFFPFFFFGGNIFGARLSFCPRFFCAKTLKVLQNFKRAPKIFFIKKKKGKET